MNITIGGYYGFGNLGDEETLRLLISQIKKEYPLSQITVLSSNTYKNAKSINRNSLKEIKKALSESEIFILGGGSLIQDSTSVRSLFYYCELIRLAHRSGCKVMLMGGGIGPLKHRRYAAEALRLCSYISVRDEYSKSILDEMNIPSALTADRILSLEGDTYSGRGRYFTVNLRKCAGRRSINAEALGDGLYPFISEGYTPIYVSMQDSFDRDTANEAVCLTGGRVITPKSIDELISLQKGAKFAVGMRLHFLISAALAGCPALALSYDPKCDCLALPSLDPYRLVPHELTDAIKNLVPVTLSTNRAKFCLSDILEIGKFCGDAVEKGRRCLK